LLCEAMRNTGVAGAPDEYFYADEESRWATTWGLRDYTYAEYVQAALTYAATPNGVSGAKMMWGYVEDFARKLRPASPNPLAELPDLLPSAFPNLRYVWLRRRDTVRQAISHWKAMRTGVWSWQTPDRPSYLKEPTLDVEAIDHLAREAAGYDAAWKSYFSENDLRPFEVVYENFVECYEETVEAILRFLEIDVPTDLGIGKRRMRRQADAQSDAWVRQYADARPDGPPS
jgi:trehalose 2-sulfotransferase